MSFSVYAEFVVDIMIMTKNVLGHGSADAKIGEFIQLDVFDDLRTLHPVGQLEQVWLVDADTERILRSSRITICSTGLTQVRQTTRYEPQSH